MCGIAGFFDSPLGAEDGARVLERMGRALRHRGPDEDTARVFPQLSAGLTCRRLCLVDLVTGSQPLASEDGTIHVLLNGEIYNHRELRPALESRGHRFRSRSDTEVIAHLYEDEGLGCLDRLDGMFALAILDGRARRLVLARDRCGMKPLYYTRSPQGFLFASEIKGLLASGLVAAQPDAGGLDTFLAIGFTPAPRTCFRGVEKLPAGECLVVEAGRGVRRHAYWRMGFDNGRPRRSDLEYAEEMESLLRAAVRSHLAADVPVGAYVSGGWDSSLVASLAARVGPSPLRTFSIIFPDDPDVNEQRFARRLAGHVGSVHEEVEFRARDLPRLLPCVVTHLDVPMATAPAVLDFALAGLAGARVKAVLSGEGADELFAGYRWLRPATDRVYTARRLIPQPLARLLGRADLASRWGRVARVLAAPDETAADAEWLRLFTPDEKRRMLATRLAGEAPDLGPVRPPSEVLDTCADRLQRLSFEFTCRLADGILTVNDAMSMAHSVEIRMPFLDRAVVDFALRLPSDLKIRGGQQKYLLSRMAASLPREIARRRKFGLHVPAVSYLGGPLRGWVREVLLDPVPGGPPFDRAYVESRLDAWLETSYGGTSPVMPLIMLQLWWNEFFGRSGAGI